jgi:hypothetical protein
VQRNSFGSLHRQALDLPPAPTDAQSAKSLPGTITLINRSFFRTTCRFGA